MMAVTSYAPAIRYLRSRGCDTVHQCIGCVIFDLPDAKVYSIQDRLYRRAEGACLTFPRGPDGMAVIDRCPHYPGPYEGVCLETPSGGPGHGGGRDGGLDGSEGGA